jgi:GNAT superfamily N-acetyltransferase
VFSPNRAASPTLEPIIEQSYHYLDHIWTGPRAESWYLECLAVHPEYQSRGHGRALVSWGMDQAQKEGIACSVIAAEGKEKFYEKCGYDSGPVGRGGEGDGNPLREVEGGIVFFRDKADVKVKARQPGDWTYGPGLFPWDAWAQGLSSNKESAEDVEGSEDWKSEEGSPWVWRDL